MQNINDNITTNFKWYEVFQSDTAARLNINNVTDDPVILGRIKYLFETCVQPARDHFGVPIRINSGYRSPELNKAVNGSPSSFHSIGAAADLSFPNFTVPLVELFKFFHGRKTYAELIAEEISDSSGWIHIAIVKGVVNKAALKYKLKGKSVMLANYNTVMEQAFNLV